MGRARGGKHNTVRFLGEKIAKTDSNYDDTDAQSMKLVTFSHFCTGCNVFFFLGRNCGVNIAMFLQLKEDFFTKINTMSTSGVWKELLTSCRASLATWWPTSGKEGKNKEKAQQMIHVSHDTACLYYIVNESNPKKKSNLCTLIVNQLK